MARYNLFYGQLWEEGRPFYLAEHVEGIEHRVLMIFNDKRNDDYWKPGAKLITPEDHGWRIEPIGEPEESHGTL